jgi:hypothetical protein
MKVYRERISRTPLILDLCAIWRSVVNFTPEKINGWRKNPHTH